MPSGNNSNTIVLTAISLLLFAITPITAREALVTLPPPLPNAPAPWAEKAPTIPVPSPPLSPVIPPPTELNDQKQIPSTLLTPELALDTNITTSVIPEPQTEPPINPPLLTGAAGEKYPNDQDDNGLPPNPSDPSWVRRCGVIRERKEFRDLTTDERERFFSAVQQLMTPPAPGRPSRYDKFVKDHHKYQKYGHKTPAFFSFHRTYIRGFERALQTIDPTVMLPYFDWSIDAQAPEASSIFSEENFGGNGDPMKEGCVTTGRFSSYAPYYPVKLLKGRTLRCIRRKFNRGNRIGALVPVEGIVKIINDAKTYVGLSKKVELYPHASLHNGMGLTFRSMWSPQDPIFFLHHAYIDKILEDWQKIDMANREFAFGGHYSNGTLANDMDILMPFRTPIRSGLSNLVQKYCYTYAPAVNAYQGKETSTRTSPAPVKKKTKKGSKGSKKKKKNKSKKLTTQVLVKRGLPVASSPSDSTFTVISGRQQGRAQYPPTRHTALTMTSPQGMTLKRAPFSQSSTHLLHPHPHSVTPKAHIPHFPALHSDAADIKADMPEEYGGGFEEESDGTTSDSASDSEDCEEEGESGDDEEGESGDDEDKDTHDHGLEHDMRMEMDEDAQVGDAKDEEEARTNPYLIPSSDRSRLLGIRVPAPISRSYAKEMGLKEEDLAEQRREMKDLALSLNRMKDYVSPTSLWNHEGALGRMIQDGQVNFTALLTNGNIIQVHANVTVSATLTPGSIKPLDPIQQMKRAVERVQGAPIRVTGRDQGEKTKKDKELQRKLQRLLGVQSAQRLSQLITAPRSPRISSPLLKAKGQGRPMCRPKKVKKCSKHHAHE